MTCCGAAIDEHVRVARHDDCHASMPLARASHLITHACNTFAFSIGSRRSTDYGAAMTRCVTYYDEWSGHAGYGIMKLIIVRMIISLCQISNINFYLRWIVPCLRNSTWPKSIIFQRPPQTRPTDSANSP